MSYLKYYDLETYLFDCVRPTFESKRVIDPIDFYMILIWKANRAKNRARDRLAQAAGSFPEAVHRIGAALSNAEESKLQLQILMQPPWRFRLATASAILTVLYPGEFTIYDSRVCEQLKDFHKLADSPFNDDLWDQYQRFKRAVKSCTPSGLSLRDKDRYLFGKSLYEQAEIDAIGTENVP